MVSTSNLLRISVNFLSYLFIRINANSRFTSMVFWIYDKWAISNMLTFDYHPPPCCSCPCPMVLLSSPLLLLMLLLPIIEDGDSGDSAGIND